MFSSTVPSWWSPRVEGSDTAIRNCMCRNSMCLCVMFHLVFFLACCIVLRESHLSSTKSSFFFFCFVLLSQSSSLWCQVEASAEGAGAGLCEKLLFDVLSMASSHEVEGEVMHNSHGLNLLYFIAQTVWVSPYFLFLLTNWIDSAHFLVHDIFIIRSFSCNRKSLLCYGKFCCYNSIPTRGLQCSPWFPVTKTWPRAQ